VIRQSIYFTAPRQLELREELLEAPRVGEVQIKTIISAISPGTEMLLYRGQFPKQMAVDESIAALSGEFGYPLKYGYSMIGHVTALGEDVPDHWQDQLVFAFQPHETAFNAPTAALMPVPDGLAPEDAVFLPNMETAVNFVMDGQPMIGEQVAVFGQGIVGLLTSSLLSRFPLSSLITIDRFAKRREASLASGAQASLSPDDPDFLSHMRNLIQANREFAGADLTFELSGSPNALDSAIALTGFNGRIVIGSWYGEKRAELNLGGTFHRSRIKLISSQVSSLMPEHSGRWSKARRLNVAWQMLRDIQPSKFITQRVPFEHAAEAYTLIDQHPDQTIQVLLSYS
jgi:2-desacetyl-2-hydroxyethyl bacteriochlorophyllide A dehydrogenase